jgi:RimJ/RimL family protein N-acetyltransferase
MANPLDPTFRIPTPRLSLWYLDPSSDSHMSFLCTVSNSPESIAVAQLAGIPPPKEPMTIASARASLVARTEKLAETGSGRYIISLNPNPNFSPNSSPNPGSGDEKREDVEGREFIGYVSMQLQRYPHLPCPTIPDLGFVLLAKYYGKGYATEACEALMRYFKETKGHERFAGFTHPRNVNSQKLFRRLGFEDRGVMDVAGVVGDGSAARIAVWTRGVEEGTELGEVGIGAGRVGV